MFDKLKVAFLSCVVPLALSSCFSEEQVEVINRLEVDYNNTDQLREVYSMPAAYWPEPHLPDDVELREIAAQPKRPSLNKNLVVLGEELFFSSALSNAQDISCATCHLESHGFAEPKKVSVGHLEQAGTRNAPGLKMAAVTAPYFWDRRATSLEEQALGPIENPIEMAATRKMVEERLNKDEYWRKFFYVAMDKKVIVLEDVAQAIAEYERSLYEETRFDDFLNGDREALTDQELQGLHLFRTKARCITCHNGPEFTDGQAYNVGLTYYGRKFEDLGLYNITGLPEDVGKFDTPTLRHISQTAPYMHNGLFRHLKGTVNLYNMGMPRPRPKGEQINDPLFPKTSDKLQKLNLTREERDALVAFLEAL